MKALLERQDPEYRKLADEICTSHISYPCLLYTSDAADE